MARRTSPPGRSSTTASLSGCSWAYRVSRSGIRRPFVAGSGRPDMLADHACTHDQRHRRTALARSASTSATATAVEITQEQVNQFAEATGDHQWIHVDVERAKAGPFGGPIAHGYLTLVAGPAAGPEIYTVSGFSMGVNYGADKIRFPSPVPVGSKLRLGAKLLDVDRRRRRHPDEDGVHVRGRGRLQAVLRRRGPLPPLRVDPIRVFGAVGVPEVRTPHLQHSDGTSPEVGDDLLGEQLERLGVGVVGAPRDEARGSRGRRRLRSSRRPARACRRGCRRASARPARPTGCACRRPRPRPRSRG